MRRPIIAPATKIIVFPHAIPAAKGSDFDREQYPRLARALGPVPTPPVAPTIPAHQ